MIHASHCITLLDGKEILRSIHCVGCRQDPKAYDAPVVCPYGVTKETATTVVAGKKMTHAELTAEDKAFRKQVGEITKCCNECGDREFCNFCHLSSCGQKKLIRNREAKCRIGKWTVADKG